MMADVANIHSLPPEILTTIFTHLPLIDRKSVRRVCSKWYACCTRSSISRNEKFIFQTDLMNIEDAERIMLKPNFSILNLEFQGLLRNNLPASSIWKMCGSRIHTLTFYNCQCDDKTIENIITHCVNLTCFTISMNNDVCSYTEFNLDHISCWPNLLDGLVQEGIRHTALHTFNIHINDMLLPGSILSKIFLLYPNLKHFNTGTGHIMRYSVSDGEHPIFPSLNCESLKSLAFNVPTDGSWIKELVEEADLKLNLEHFETIIYYSDDNSMKKTLFKFFSFQKNLNVVKLGLWRQSYRPDQYLSHEDDLYKITLHILKSCPNLQELNLEFHPFYTHIDWTARPELTALILKLKVFSLKFPLAIYNKDFQEISISLAQTNFALTMLRLDKCHVNEELVISFLQHCPALKHLELFLDCTDAILQAIFKELLMLQTLILKEIDQCTDYGFTGRDTSKEVGYSIKRLQELKCFNIQGCGECPTKLTEKFLLDLQLPNLENLELFHVNLYKQISVETLNQLATFIPKLKTLGISLIEYANVYDNKLCLMEKSVAFCNHFKYLEHLASSWYSPIEEAYNEFPEFFEYIFRKCPSLKYISNGIDVIKFNSFTNEIFCKDIRSVALYPHQSYFSKKNF